MVLVIVAGRFLRFRLLQDTFEIGVNDEWHSFLPTVVLETQPLVILARQPDGAIIYLFAIHSVGLQFFARAKVDICKKKYFFFILSKSYKIFYNFFIKRKHTDRKRISCVHIY